MMETGETPLTLRYQPGSATIGELDAELNSILGELSVSGSRLAAAAAETGVSTNDLDEARGSVSQEGKGFGVVIVLIAIFAPAGNHVLRTLWDNLILPRVKSELGADALGEEADTDLDSEDGDEDSDD